MTMVDWLKDKLDPFVDLTDGFILATLLHRGIDDDETTVASVDERTRDLCLADAYFSAAISSQKSGTQGESDGGWTHYVAIKNVINRDALLNMARSLYEKWGEVLPSTAPKVALKPLY